MHISRVNEFSQIIQRRSTDGGGIGTGEIVGTVIGVLGIIVAIIGVLGTSRTDWRLWPIRKDGDSATTINTTTTTPDSTQSSMGLVTVSSPRTPPPVVYNFHIGGSAQAYIGIPLSHIPSDSPASQQLLSPATFSALPGSGNQPASGSTSTGKLPNRAQTWPHGLTDGSGVPVAN